MSEFANKIVEILKGLIDAVGVIAPIMVTVGFGNVAQCFTVVVLGVTFLVKLMLNG